VVPVGYRLTLLPHSIGARLGYGAVPEAAHAQGACSLTQTLTHTHTHTRARARKAGHGAHAACSAWGAGVRYLTETVGVGRRTARQLVCVEHSLDLKIGAVAIELAWPPLHTGTRGDSREHPHLGSNLVDPGVNAASWQRVSQECRNDTSIVLMTHCPLPVMHTRMIREKPSQPPGALRMPYPRAHEFVARKRQAVPRLRQLRVRTYAWHTYGIRMVPSRLEPRRSYI
jgi:hypothetical protein